MDATNNRSMANEAPEQEGMEIDLVELLYRLLEKIKWVILLAVVGAVIAGFYTIRMVTPMYRSTSKLYVLSTKDSVLNLSDLQIGTQLTNDYVQVFSNWHVHEMVMQKLNITDMSYSELSSRISVSNPSGTRILFITATDPSAERARQLAQTYAEVSREFIASKMGTEMPNIFEEARKPARPFSPNRTRNIAIGFLLGGMLAAAIIVIQFLVDDRVRTGEIIEKRIGLSTLGLMPIQEGDVGKSGSGHNRSRKRKHHHSGSAKGGSKS